MEKSNLFVDGLFVSRRENALDFVISNLSFNEKFIDYLKSNFNQKGYVNIDILKSKEGKLYAKLNDWKPSEKFVKNEDGSLGTEEVEDEININKIPF